jgi:hypothetical protein
VCRRKRVGRIRKAGALGRGQTDGGRRTGSLLILRRARRTQQVHAAVGCVVWRSPCKTRHVPIVTFPQSCSRQCSTSLNRTATSFSIRNRTANHWDRRKGKGPPYHNFVAKGAPLPHRKEFFLTATAATHPNRSAVQRCSTLAPALPCCVRRHDTSSTPPADLDAKLSPLFADKGDRVSVPPPIRCLSSSLLLDVVVGGVIR